MLCGDKGEMNKAIEYFEMALKIDLDLFKVENEPIARDYNNIGAAWCSIGDFDKAIEYGEKSYSIIVRLYGEEHKYSKLSKANLDEYNKIRQDNNL
jgi:tetratricopeptide (TPR) repeat protein